MSDNIPEKPAPLGPCVYPPDHPLFGLGTQMPGEWEWSDAIGWVWSSIEDHPHE